MTSCLKTIILSTALVLIPACGGLARAYDSSSVVDLAGNPHSYDQHHIVVRGVLSLTSEGLFLVRDCDGKRQFSLNEAIAVPNIDADKLLSQGAIGSVVELTGKFVARDETKVNSRHKLIGAKYVGRISDSLCAA